MIGTKILETKKSKFNGELRVIKSWGLGTYIQAGGLTQSGGIVEKIWKQTLQKIQSINPNVKTCLILGLGGGSAASQVSKLWPGVIIHGVDIDNEIVTLGKKYLGLNHFNVKIVINDAMKYVRELADQSKIYDLVMVDLYNGSEFPARFTQRQFLILIKDIVSRDGFIVINRLRSKNNKQEIKKFEFLLSRLFTSTEVYFPTTNIMFFCRR